MATPATIEFDDLLQPIPGEDPAGSSFPFTLRQELEQARKEDNPDDYDPGDPRRPTEAKSADWPHIVRTTKDALINTSKDLQIAARLTEALTRMYGYAGLRDGLHLMFLLIDQCWDRLMPAITEPDDIEARASAFNWLDDPDRGAVFPNTVRAAPLIIGPQSYSLTDWKQLQQGKGNVKKEDFEKAVQIATAEDCQNVAEDLAGCLDEIAAITHKSAELMGHAAPGLTMIRMVIDESNQVMQQILRKKIPASAAEDEEQAAAEGESGEQGGEGEGVPRRRGKTRADIYQQILELATQLQEIEPHSPIPYLMRKAFDLGNLPFPLLIRALVRNDDVLGELSRELGLTEADMGSGQSSSETPSE